MTANMAEPTSQQAPQEPPVNDPSAGPLLFSPEEQPSTTTNPTRKPSTKENKAQRSERQLTVRRAQEQLSRKSTMPPTALLGLGGPPTAVPPPSPSFLPSQIFEEGLFERNPVPDGFFSGPHELSKEVKSSEGRKVLPARRLPSILVSGDSHLATSSRGALSAKRKPAFLSTSLAGAAKGTGRTVQKKVSTVKINSALDEDDSEMNKNKSNKSAKKNSESAVSELLDANNQKLVMGLFGKKTRAISAHDFPSTLRSYSSPPSSASPSLATSAVDEEAWLLASAALAAAASNHGLVGPLGSFFKANAKGYCSPKFCREPAAIQALISAASNEQAGRLSHAGLVKEGVGGKQQRSYSDQVQGTPQQFPGAKSTRSKSYEVRRVSKERNSPPTSYSGDSSAKEGGSVGPNSQLADFEVKGTGIFKRPAEENGPLSGFTLGPMMWNPQESYDIGRICTADLMFDDMGIRRWLNSIRDPNDQDDLTAAIDELSKLGPSAAAAAAAHVMYISQQTGNSAPHQSTSSPVTATRCEITLRGDGLSNNPASRPGSRSDIHQDQDDVALLTSAAAAAAVGLENKSKIGINGGQQQKKRLRRRSKSGKEQRSTSQTKSPLLDEHAFQDVPRMTLVDVPITATIEDDPAPLCTTTAGLADATNEERTEHQDPLTPKDGKIESDPDTNDEPLRVPRKQEHEGGDGEGRLGSSTPEGVEKSEQVGHQTNDGSKKQGDEKRTVSEAAAAEKGSDIEKTI